jgi:hypothetical protein
MSGEQSLWRAVVLRALDDACGFVADPDANRRDKERIVACARLWFERGGGDFREVCLLAGLDPGRVRRGALAWIGRNLGQAGAGRVQPSALAREPAAAA